MCPASHSQPSGNSLALYDGRVYTNDLLDCWSGPSGQSSSLAVKSDIVSMFVPARSSIPSLTVHRTFHTVNLIYLWYRESVFGLSRAPNLCGLNAAFRLKLLYFTTGKRNPGKLRCSVTAQQLPILNLQVIPSMFL